MSSLRGQAGAMRASGHLPRQARVPQVEVAHRVAEARPAAEGRPVAVVHGPAAPAPRST